MRYLSLTLTPVFPATRSQKMVLTRPQAQGSFPAVNVVRLDDSRLSIELALAGFKKDELSVTLENRVIKVVGKKDNDQAEYLLKEITTRSFQVEFPALNEYEELVDVKFEDGLLKLQIKHVMPDHLKPKTIPIV